MMKRLSDLFRRKTPMEEPTSDPGQPAPAERLGTREPAVPLPNASRQDWLSTIDQGFGEVCDVLAHLDQHLQGTTELIARLQHSQDQIPELIQAQNRLIQIASASERGNQAVLQALASHFKTRDEVNQALVQQVGGLASAVHREREIHQDQLQLVLRLQRSSRRFLVLMLAVIGLVAAMLLALLLAQSLRPDLLHHAMHGSATTPRSPAPAPEEDPTNPDVQTAHHGPVFDV